MSVMKIDRHFSFSVTFLSVYGDGRKPLPNTWSRTYRLDAKSLEEAFEESYKRLEMIHAMGHNVLVATITETLSFLPVPHNCGDCKFIYINIEDNRQKMQEWRNRNYYNK